MEFHSAAALLTLDTHHELGGEPFVVVGAATVVAGAAFVVVGAAPVVAGAAPVVAEGAAPVVATGAFVVATGAFVVTTGAFVVAAAAAAVVAGAGVVTTADVVVITTLSTADDATVEAVVVDDAEVDGCGTVVAGGTASEPQLASANDPKPASTVNRETRCTVVTSNVGEVKAT